MKKLFFILLSAICLNLNAQVCFSPVVNYPAAVQPVGICSANLNNDGFLDAVVTNSASNSISVFLGSSTGVFSFVNNFTSGSRPLSVFAGHFNTDQFMDLAIANYQANNINVKLGDGTGSFTSSINYTTGTSPHSVHGGDFDGDNDIDLVVANNIGNNVSVFFGNGLGAFSTMTLYPCGPNPYAVFVTDFQGDGDLDIVTANSGAANVSVLLGTNNGTFATAVTYTTGSNPLDVFSADINNDNFMDIITAGQSGANNICVLYGISTGSFSPSVNYTVPNAPHGVTCADFNGDGYKDVATTRYVGNAVSILYGSLSGTLSAHVAYAVGSQPWKMVSADFNNDGKPDIATANHISNNMSVLLNTAPFLTVAATSTALCLGNSATLTVSGANTYSWSTTNTTNSISITPLSTTVYTVKGVSSVTGCSATVSRTITVNPTPTVSISGSTFICAGYTTNLSANGATTYSWNTTATTSAIVVSPTITSTYSVTGYNSFNCPGSATHTLTTTSLITPSICLVTADSLGNNNEIFWEKTLYPKADTFIVLRETSSQVYTPIARISKNSFSSYSDTNRATGQFNGNPKSTFYKYKIRYRDTCGNYSALSPYHQSIYISDLQTGQFNWNYYFIEGIGNVQSASYTLWRQNVLTGLSNTVGSTSGNLFNDTQYSQLSLTGNVKWYVSTTGFICNPSAKPAATVTRTKSNNTNERQFPGDVSISEFRNIKLVSLFPNPADQQINLVFKGIKENIQIEMTDVAGRKILDEKCFSENHEINTEKFMNGVYFLVIKQDGQNLNTYKIIIQH